MVAREVLGTDLCIQEFHWPYRQENNFGYNSWYTSYTPPVIGLLEDSSFPSPLLSESTPGVSRYYSPIAGVPPYSVCPIIDTSGNAGTPSNVVSWGECLLRAPVALQGLEDPTSIKDLIDLNLFDACPQDELEVEDPLPEISKTRKRKKGDTKALQVKTPLRPRTRAAIKRNAEQSNLGQCPTATKQGKLSGKYCSDHSDLVAASPHSRHDGAYRMCSTEAGSEENGKEHVTTGIAIPEDGSHEKLQSSEECISQDPSMLSSTASNDVALKGVNDSSFSQTTCASGENLLESSEDSLHFEVVEGYATEVVIPATHDQELSQLDLQSEPTLLAV